MKNKQLFSLISLLFISAMGFGQKTDFASYEDGILTLDNGIIHRVINLDPDVGTYTTSVLGLSDDNFNFISTEQYTHEFRFTVYNIPLSGLNQWKFESVENVEDDMGGNGATVTLRGTAIMSGIELQITYLLYPDLPGIRKRLSFVNHGDDDIMLESIDVEHLNMTTFLTNKEVYNHYCRNKHHGPYVGDWDDPVLALHFAKEKKGAILVNEAPGVLKRIACMQENSDFSAGLTHSDQMYPFRKWITKGESYTTPDVFLILYKEERNPLRALNFLLPDYVRKHMGLEIFGLDYKPVFVYNTWNPFRKDVEAGMIGELVEAASECGIQEFIIDDGWQINTYTERSPDDPWWYPEVGDYLIDEKKFPEGLKPVFKDIRKRGMKPGLWLSIGSASESSAVYREHPEWFVRDELGNIANLHIDGVPGLSTACMSTDWTTHIEKVILDLVEDHDLAYTKLDFAIVTSAYVHDPAISGCYAADHDGHKDHQESFISNYHGLFGLFDDLQEKAPELFIDCTFEAQGKLHLIDYAFLKHAEGNWLSNIEEETPIGALRVRHLAWKRTPVIPAASCVIGNLRLDSEDLEFDFLSTIGTFPIMLGDIRELPSEKRKWLKSWSGWLQEMQEEYDYMSYRQDLQNFGEPMEGHWDGWQRINTETQAGGIVGVFRQGSIEQSRRVSVEGLLPASSYDVRTAVEGDLIGSYTGAELATEGFVVELENLYQGHVFEIKVK